ncbi:MAG: hypothetical protein ACOZB3_03125 [Calditrichota bacterium]
MKIILFILTLTLLLTLGCNKKQPVPDSTMERDPHAGLDMDKMKQMQSDPHAGMNINSGGLDLDGMMANLPEGWSKVEPSSTMRIAQINLAPAKGDDKPAELAVFHFPGTGGSSMANIVRWQNQFKGPKGEPGPDVAKTDTMMVGLLTVITTDVSGTQLGGGAAMGTGPADDTPGQRMIASVIETASGNWFIKVVGPEKTVAAHSDKIRSFVKQAKMKEANPHGHM